MKIVRLEIENFRAVRYASLTDLNDTVVVAGPNGCGKSCLFDAIRLVKSIYGGYQKNEWQQWFGEFQIDLQKEAQLLKLFHDRSRAVRVSARFHLSESETEYLRSNCFELCKTLLWAQVSPGGRYTTEKSSPSLASQLREHRDKVEADAQSGAKRILLQLEKSFFDVDVSVSTKLDIKSSDCELAELIFSTYDPEHIGIIDFHGAHRNYQRENIGGINLNISSIDSKFKQHVLYGISNKYSNIKSQMAGHYVRDLLVKEAGGYAGTSGESLIETLEDLFSTFFPDKEFSGPRPVPDGSLDFPVKLSSGAVHDIDELSSGEKEILYGYLRLRDEAPRHSVLLLDEPELHLNPRLIKGLPQFYQRHLGKALGNQIWLITHSDAFLRQAVGQAEFSVFHMKGPTEVEESEDQIAAIVAPDALQAAIMDLVGDLPSWRPEGKHVIFEGDQDVEFDVRMTCSLFPHFERLVNPIAGKSKPEVQRLHRLLEDAALTGNLPGRFYAIVDHDAEIETNVVNTRIFVWNVYHIENYLLEPTYILSTLRDLTAWYPTEDELLGMLRECARGTLSDLVGHHLEQKANRMLIQQIKTRTSRKEGQIAAELNAAIETSIRRMTDIADNSLTLELLKREEKIAQNRLVQDLKGDDWRKTFKGRDLLRRFVSDHVSKHVGRIGYEEFRDLIVARMRDARFEPAGMREVVQAILEGD
jgi:AAA15 family ATPase/GTPase